MKSGDFFVGRGSLRAPITVLFDWPFTLVKLTLILMIWALVSSLGSAFFNASKIRLSLFLISDASKLFDAGAGSTASVMLQQLNVDETLTFCSTFEPLLVFLKNLMGIVVRPYIQYKGWKGDSRFWHSPFRTKTNALSLSPLQCLHFFECSFTVNRLLCPPSSLLEAQL